MATLNSVLNDVAAFIDQDTALATGTELTVRINLVNQAQNEWAEAYQWKQLKTPANLTFALSATSIGLPTNFDRLVSPIYDVSVTPNTVYPQIYAQDKFKHNDQDKYVLVEGNDVSGKYLTFNPGMASGMSLNYYYQATPSSLATLQDIPTCPSSMFLTKRTIAYILQSRSDSRFPTLKAESDDMLSNMIDDEAAIPMSQDNRVSDVFRSNNFRVGQD